MWSRIKQLLSNEPVPLTGAPAVRRQKSYSAQSGYVYQYFYEGQRPAGAATEFVFNVSADRKTSFPLSILVPESGYRAWEASNGRALASNERYAVAKMALFEAFDERENPAALGEPVRVEDAQVLGHLSSLDL